jgi:hypothetical protein
MKKFKTYNQLISDWTDNIRIEVPPFSKVVDVNILDNTFLVIVEIDTMHEYGSENKSFFFQIKKEMEFETMLPIGYEFLKTIIIDNPMISSTSNGYGGPTANISFNIISEKKIYRIFVQEIKNLVENRDSKLDNLLEESIK